MRGSTQGAGFNALSRLHPWWTQAWLHGLRSFDGLRLAACIALAGATLVAIIAMRLDATAARAVLEQRHLFAAATAIVLFFSLRMSAAKAARSLRHGWMAALPMPIHSGPRTLVSAATLFGMLVFAWFALGLGGLGADLGLSAYLAVLGPLCAGIATACVGLAGIALHAWRRPMAIADRRGLRVPLLSLAWLEHGRLPSLVAWQHRECAQQWRMGGGAKPVGLVLLLFPGSPSRWELFGLIGVVLVLAWHRCLLQSSLQVAERTALLTRQWTLPPRDVARVLLRLPLAASALACVLLFALLLTMQPPLWAAASAVPGLALASPITLVRLVACYRKLAS